MFRDTVANAERLDEARDAGVEIDTRVALSMAMSGLELDRDRFSALLGDDDAFTAALRRHRPTAVPMTQSTIGQPAAAGPVPKPRARGGLFRRGRRSPAGDGPAVPIDVNEPVRAALSRGMPRVARRSGRQLEFGTTLRDGLPRVPGRPPQIEEVVTVLLDNAVPADPAREDPRSRLAAAPGTGARPHHRGRRSGRQHRFHHRGRPWHDRPGTPANRLSGLGIEDFHGDDLVVGRVRAADDVPFRGRAGSQRDVDVDVWTFERGRADWPRTRSGRFARASGQIVRARAVARVAVGQRN